MARRDRAQNRLDRGRDEHERGDVEHRNGAEHQSHGEPLPPDRLPIEAGGNTNPIRQ